MSADDEPDDDRVTLDLSWVSDKARDTLERFAAAHGITVDDFFEVLGRELARLDPANLPPWWSQLFAGAHRIQHGWEASLVDETEAWLDGEAR